MLRTPERSDREGERNRRQVDWKFWVPIASALVGGASLIAGTFVSSTCTKYGPGENGCIEYGFDLLGRGITVAGLILLFSGLYVIFAPHIGWPLVPPEPQSPKRACGAPVARGPPRAGVCLILWAVRLLL